MRTVSENRGSKGASFKGAGGDVQIPFLCKFAGHMLDRKRVRHDGEDFRGYCKRCDAPMIKIIDEWHEYRAEVHDIPEV